MTSSICSPNSSKWPEFELEHLGKCPLCSSTNRDVSYDCLQDRVFFCAGGRWTLWRCHNCNVSYLDPRIKPAFIYKAYKSYYTHRNSVEGNPLSLKARIKHSIESSYINKRYSINTSSLFDFGWLAYYLLPASLSILKNRLRDLPRPTSNQARLLDIGCGNGEFLLIARRLGYLSEGLEVDPVARRIAVENGMTVHPGPWPGSGLTEESYEQVTMNHVIEHLHDPRLALEEVYRLLKPGGRVWMQTPNIRASSLKRFKQNSRLLEPPRHMVMFSHNSLRHHLESMGFSNIRIFFSKSIAKRDFNFTVAQSWMIENKLDPYNTRNDKVPRCIYTDTQKFADTSEEEYIRSDTVTMAADKPTSNT